MTTITSVAQSWSGEGRGYVESGDYGADVTIFCNDADPNACEVHLKLWKDEAEEGDGPAFAGPYQACVDWAEKFRTDPPATLAEADELLSAYAVGAEGTRAPALRGFVPPPADRPGDGERLAIIGFYYGDEASPASIEVGEWRLAVPADWTADRLEQELRQAAKGRVGGLTREEYAAECAYDVFNWGDLITLIGSPIVRADDLPVRLLPAVAPDDAVRLHVYHDEMLGNAGDGGEEAPA